MTKTSDTRTEIDVNVAIPGLQNQIHAALVNLVHLVGVITFGTLAIAILATLAIEKGATLGALMAAASAAAAWFSQSNWAFNQNTVAHYAAWTSAALGAASALLTYLGV